MGPAALVGGQVSRARRRASSTAPALKGVACPAPARRRAVTSPAAPRPQSQRSALGAQGILQRVSRGGAPGGARRATKPAATSQPPMEACERSLPGSRPRLRGSPARKSHTSSRPGIDATVVTTTAHREAEAVPGCTQEAAPEEQPAAADPPPQAASERGGEAPADAAPSAAADPEPPAAAEVTVADLWPAGKTAYRQRPESVRTRIAVLLRRLVEAGEIAPRRQSGFGRAGAWSWPPGSPDAARVQRLLMQLAAGRIHDEDTQAQPPRQVWRDHQAPLTFQQRTHHMVAALRETAGLAPGAPLTIRRDTIAPRSLGAKDRTHLNMIRIVIGDPPPRDDIMTYLRYRFENDQGAAAPLLALQLLGRHPELRALYEWPEEITLLPGVAQLPTADALEQLHCHGLFKRQLPLQSVAPPAADPCYEALQQAARRIRALLDTTPDPEPDALSAMVLGLALMVFCRWVPCIAALTGILESTCSLWGIYSIRRP